MPEPDRLVAGRSLPYVEIGLFVAPQQGASYHDQLAAARAAERSGFSDFVRSDHYLGFGEAGLPGPTDSWVTLAGLAARPNGSGWARW